MITPTSDSRQLVPTRESPAAFSLILHRNTPDGEAPTAGEAAHGEVSRDLRLDATHMHHPTPAECYGCVEWFHY